LSAASASFSRRFFRVSCSAAFFLSVASWGDDRPPGAGTGGVLERIAAKHEPLSGPCVEAFHRFPEGEPGVDAGFRKKPVERLPEDLRVRPPDEFPERPVASPDPAVRIGQEEHVGDAIDRAFPLLLARRHHPVRAGKFVVLLL
jgi:hypothetical protein